MTQSISQGFEYLSKSELIQKLRQIKDSHIPSSQAIYIIKQLLSSVPEPDFVIEEIPNILACSSSEFIELLPSFKTLITDNPLCVSKLLQILNSFDYDNNSKRLAHELALQIFEKIGKDQIPDLVPFLLFTASKNSILSLFDQMKQILLVQENPQIYKSFEVGIRPHLSSFFHCLSVGSSIDSKWTFFDFFLLIISQSRPSLRSQIPTLVWNSIISKKLTFHLIIQFCEHIETLNAHFNLLSSLYNLIVNNTPKCYETSSIGHLSMLAIKIVNCYPDHSAEFVDEMISYILNGTNFLVEIASHCLLSISPSYYTNHITELDDCLSQRSGFMSATSLQTLCKLISMNGTIKSSISNTSNEARIQEFHQSQSVLMISLQKKLFSTSHIMVEAGVNLALQFTSFLNFDEILEWVLKAIRADRLVEASLRPSILLSVVDLIWAKLRESEGDNHLIDEIFTFCTDVVQTFSIIVKIQKNDSCIGSERKQYAISSKLIPTEHHATLCGEVIYLIYHLISHHKIIQIEDENESEDESDNEKKKVSSQKKIDDDYILCLKDISAFCFKVPTEFIKLVSNPDESVRLKPIHVSHLVNTRAMIIPIMYRLTHNEIATILFYMDIVNTIDSFFKAGPVTKMRFVPESFENTQFPSEFCISILSNCFFDFPSDLNFVYLLLKSIWNIFVDTINHRFTVCDKISFLMNKMPQSFPARIMTLVESMINLSVIWRKENKINYVKQCIRAASYGLDFVSFCISCGIDTNLDFTKSVMDLLEIDEDAGVACRIILIGAFLGINKADLSQLAAQSFIGWRMTCDLSEISFIYPFGFDHLSESVKPFNEGESWRLLVYLSLQFADFDSYSNQFNALLDRINNGSIEIQMCFTLVDILIYRMNDFIVNFPDICDICYKIVLLLTHSDLSVLRLISKMLHDLNNLKKKFIVFLNSLEKDEKAQKSSKCQNCINKIDKYLASQFQDFKGIQNKLQIKSVMAQIQGECALLAENNVNISFPNLAVDENDEINKDKNEERSNANPFEIESSSDNEFKVPDSSEEDSSSSSY